MKTKFTLFVLVVLLACSHNDEVAPVNSSKSKQDYTLINNLLNSDQFNSLSIDANNLDLKNATSGPHNSETMLVIPFKKSTTRFVYGLFSKDNLLTAFSGSLTSKSSDPEQDFNAGKLVGELNYTLPSGDLNFKIKRNTLVAATINSRTETCRNKDDVMNCVGRSIEAQQLAQKILCYWGWAGCFIGFVVDCYLYNCDLGYPSKYSPLGDPSTPTPPIPPSVSSTPVIDYLHSKSWKVSSWDPSWDGTLMDPNSWVVETSDGWIYSRGGYAKARLAEADPNTLNVYNTNPFYLAYTWVPVTPPAPVTTDIIEYLRTKTWVASCDCPGFDGVLMNPDQWTREDEGILYDDQGSKAILVDPYTLNVYNIEGNYLAFQWIPVL